MPEVILFERYWWAFLFRGVFAILFSIAAFFWPGITTERLVLIFGVYVLVEGIVAMVSAIKAVIEHRSSWLMILDGFFSMVLGAMSLSWPGRVTMAIVILVAVWALLSGILEIVGSFCMPWSLRGKIMVGIPGTLSFILGLFMILFPAAGAMALVWLIGAYVSVFGITQVALAFHLRRAPELGRHGGGS